MFTYQALIEGIKFDSMTFDEYLTGKKIDSQRFREEEPDVWASWLHDFEQQHPASFTAQKLYLINAIRRKYHLKATAPTPPSANVPAGKAARPVFKPKPKM